MEGGAVTAMSLNTGYGRFAAAFNSLLAALALCLAPAHAQTAPAGSAVKLVVLGDSLAAGFGVKPEQSFPSPTNWTRWSVRLRSVKCLRVQEIPWLYAGKRSD